MRKFVLIALYFFAMIFSFSPVFADNFYDNVDDIELVSSFETKNCFASYVMINGIKYLVKQKKDYKKQLAAVRDALAAFIAHDLAIAHDVYVVAAKKRIFLVKNGLIGQQRFILLHVEKRSENSAKVNIMRYVLSSNGLTHHP